MKCEQALQALQSDGPQPLAETHVAACSLCQKILDVELASDTLGLGAASGDSQAAETGSPTSDAGALDRAILRERGFRGFARSLSTPVRRGAIVAAVTGLLIFWRFGSPRADMAAYPLGRWVFEVAAIGVVCTVLLMLASRPSHRASDPSRTRPALEMLLAAVAVTTVLVLFAMGPAHTMHPASLAGIGDDFARRAVACFLAGSLTAAPILGLTLWADRWAGLRRDAVVAASAGAFLVGTLGLHLHCPIVHTQHLLAGHYAVLLPMALFGAIWFHLASKQSANRQSANRQSAN